MSAAGDPLTMLANQAAAQRPFDPLEALATGQVVPSGPQPPKAATPHTNRWIDAAKSFGAGLLQNLPSPDSSGPLQTNENDPQFAQTHLPAEMVKPIPGSTYQPQTTAGKYARTVGQFAPNIFFGEGAIPKLANVVLPAVGSETMGQAAEGTGAENVARIGGALLGSGTAGGSARLASLLKGDGTAAAAAVTPQQRTAAKLLITTLGKDKISPEDAISTLRGDPTGQMTLADLGGENSNTQRLARALVTMPGDQSKEITNFLTARSSGQRGRILGNIADMAPDTDTYGIRSDLSKERSVNSDPLYTKAFASAGVGPVDYEGARNDLIAATSQKASIAKQIKSIEKNNSGALAARGAAGAGVRDNYMNLRQQLQESEAARQAAASKFENAQAGLYAMESDQPLTDQRLADFLKDPDIKAGMQKGLSIQKRVALANGEDFDPNAYAVTGYDEKGLPQVGPVPTWRTLHAGREGLDATINEFRDPITQALPNTKLVNSYKELRKAYSDHLHTLNPDLAAADAAWSGPSQKMDAIALGAQLLKSDPEQIIQASGRLNQETTPYYKVGAGRALRDVANDTKDSRDITARMTGDQTSRDQLSAAFGPDADKFLNAMEAERLMNGTKNFVLSGSQTANKLGDLVKPSLFGKLASDAVTGATVGFLSGGPEAALHGAVGVPLMNAGKDLAAALSSKLHPLKPGTAAELGKYLTTSGKSAASEVQDAKAILEAQRAESAAKRAALVRQLIVPSALALQSQN